MGSWARNSTWKYIKIGKEADDRPATPPSGKITITENGTDIDVSSYATADVAVSGGSSDFSTAEVTVTNNAGEEGSLLSVNLVNITNESVEVGQSIAKGYSADLTALLYKGTNYCYPADDSVYSYSVTGDAEIDVDSETGDEYGVYITGDCTITISDAQS